MALDICLLRPCKSLQHRRSPLYRSKLSRGRAWAPGPHVTKATAFHESLWKDRNPKGRRRSIRGDVTQAGLGSQFEHSARCSWISLALCPHLRREEMAFPGLLVLPRGRASQNRVWLACSSTAPYWEVCCQGVKRVAF